MNERGQALIELAVFSFIVFALLAIMMAFTKWIVIRQKLLMASKEGALLYSSGRFTKQEVETRITHYLEIGRPALLRSGIQVSFRRSYATIGFLDPLDRVTVRYTTESDWPSLLRVGPTIEETSIVRHAPDYWAFFLPLGGPPVKS